ncbi:MAG: CHRD domain-containing protein, partial [Planctomycetes bacterium]|nr:CHRD domain-containing protein [Planctomycetota bacterium]
MLRTLITLALASSLSAQVTYYSAKLDAQQEVPPTASSAVGYGIVRIEEPANSVRIWVHHVGLSGAPTSGHLHQGAVGANGGIIAVMTAAAGTNVMSGSATLSAAQIALIKSGNTYLNLHTATLPGGEIRGQVVAPVSTRLEAELDGAQEVPPTSSTATGRAIAFLHEPDNRLVYCVETTGLGAVTAGHVHRGAVGTNGAIMVPMVGSGGTFCGVSDILSAADAALVLAGDTYTNV